MKVILVLGSTALVAGCLIAGGIAGSALGALSQGDLVERSFATNTDGQIVSPLSSETVFRVNEAGETYGRGDLETIPDLVLAVGDDGTEGYVRDSELFPKLPDSPEERARFRDQVRTVPLYESDGKTVVGTFTLQIGFSGTREPLDVEIGEQVAPG